MSSIKLERAVCAGCSCLCDDLVLTNSAGFEPQIVNACPLGETWLRQPRSLVPQALLGGRDVPVEQAIAAIAERLLRCHAPAMVGLTGLTQEGAHAAVDLARTVSAVVIPDESALAGERTGLDTPEFTASLGAIRNTADVVFFWRADPVRTHPRHLERYSGDAPLRSGQARKVFVVEGAECISENQTARVANDCFSIPADEHGLRCDAELALLVHLHLANEPLPKSANSVLATVASFLASVIETAEHAHIVLGCDAAEHLPLSGALHQMAAVFKHRLHLTVSDLGRNGNARGLAELLTWRTGNPGPYWSGEGNSQWLPGVVDIARLNGADACDLVFVLGDVGEPAAGLLAASLARPRIVLGTRPDPAADVFITIPGLDPRLAATVMRCDGVPLTLCGDPTFGIADPVVNLLRDIHRRVSAAAEVDQ